jgi:uncharacterized membrane protein
MPIDIEKSVTILGARGAAIDALRRTPVLLHLFADLALAERRRLAWVGGLLGAERDRGVTFSEFAEQGEVCWRARWGEGPSEAWICTRDALGEPGTEVRIRLLYHPAGGAAEALVSRVMAPEAARAVANRLSWVRRALATGPAAPSASPPAEVEATYVPAGRGWGQVPSRPSIPAG